MDPGLGTDYDHLFKFIIVGDSGVGKSSLLCRFVDDTFSPTFIPTIGVDFKIKTMTYKNQRVKLQLWDTAGQERFHAITRAYYKGADGIIIVYDVTDGNSFVHVRDWLEEVRKFSPAAAVSLIVGNKNDLKGKVVDAKQVETIQQELQIPVVETSAKDSTNVETAFQVLLKRLMEQRVTSSNLTSGEQKPKPSNVDLRGEKVKDGGCAC